MTSATAIVVFAHGSRIEAANDAVRAVSAGLARASGFPLVETAFLDLGQPDLPAAVERLVHTGVQRILVIPYFLTAGMHTDRDLPEIVDQLSRAYPGVEIRISPPLDGHPALVDILRDRARETLAEWG